MMAVVAVFSVCGDDGPDKKNDCHRRQGPGDPDLSGDDAGRDPRSHDGALPLRAGRSHWMGMVCRGWKRQLNWCVSVSWGEYRHAQAFSERVLDYLLTRDPVGG